MAVAYVNANSASNNNTVAVNCTGADGLIGACTIGFYSGLQTVSMTYNGVSMTAEVQNVGSGFTWQIYMFSLANPATGSNNLVYSGPTSTGNIGGVALSGVDTSDVVNATATANAASSNTSVTYSSPVSSATDDMVVDAVSGNSAGTTSGTNTERVDLGNGSYRLLMSTAPGASPTVNMTWTLSTSQTWRSACVNVKAAAAGGATTRGMPLGTRGTAFNGGRALRGILRRLAFGPVPVAAQASNDHSWRKSGCSI